MSSIVSVLINAAFCVVKGIIPDVLTMTATPIPRTLAITAFGDLDVSTLRERPQGRKPIKTYWVKHEYAGSGTRFHPQRGGQRTAGVFYLSAY